MSGNDPIPAGFWRDRKVLITGGTGLVGSWLVPALVQRGASVVALVRDSSPRSRLVREGWLDRVASVHGSLTEENLLQRTMAEYSIQTVFHLGAQTLVGVAKADPVGTLDCNVRGTWNLLSAARQTGVKEVLIASSILVARSDKPLEVPSDAIQARFPYEVSKICAERLAQMYARTYGLRVGVVRCGNLYGGGDLNFSRLVPGAVLATLRGDNFRFRSDGKFMRDFLYVEDAVNAYLQLAEHLSADPDLSGEPFNFGLGLRYAMLDVIEKILRTMGRPELRPIVEKTPSVEIAEEALDSSRARQRLGWTPAVGIDQGLQRTVDWYREYFEEDVRSARGACMAATMNV